MSTFETSLRCFKHPVTIFSIGLLILNDHLLKAAVPSWWTGKLSDFAGLFFFPFLLAAALTIPLGRTRLSSRSIGSLAFVMTAIWFVLMKTTAWGNALTDNLISTLLHTRAQIVLDPSDLIAMPAMIPAWVVWGGTESDVEQHPSWVAWLALLVAAFASMATSCFPYPTIGPVVAEDGVLYASYWGGSIKGIAQSQDGGQTWHVVSNVAPALEEKVQHGTSRLNPACDPANSRVCYRIDGQTAQVERSDDGGETWRVDWSAPAARQSFMERVNRGLLSQCGRPLSLVPSYITVPGQSNLPEVVATIPYEGVLVKTRAGRWERYGVLEAHPTPFAAESLDQAFGTTLGEAALWLVLAIIVLPVVCVGCWHRIEERVRQRENAASLRSPVSRPFALTVLGTPFVCIILSWLLASLSSSGRLDFKYLQFVLSPFFYVLFSAPWVILLFPIGILLLGLGLSWRRAARISSHPRRAWKAAGWCLLTALGVFPLGYVPWLLWAFGVIPFYELTWIIAPLLTVVVLIRAKRKAERWSDLAVEPQSERP